MAGAHIPVLKGLQPEASYPTNTLRMGLLCALYGCQINDRAFGCLYKDKTPIIMRHTKGRARDPRRFSQPNVSKIATILFQSSSEPSIATSKSLQKVFTRREYFPLYEHV